jgi:phospholipid/cholesterol/gamma-HCH transport system substrate-binding protein
VDNLRDVTPVLESLANAGRDLTRALSVLITFPFPQAGIDNFLRGDYANLYIHADATMPRLAETMLLGTEFGNRMAGVEGYIGLAPNPLAGADPYSLDVPRPEPAPDGAPAPDGVPAAAGAATAPAQEQTGEDPAPAEPSATPTEEAPR